MNTGGRPPYGPGVGTKVLARFNRNGKAMKMRGEVVALLGGGRYRVRCEDSITRILTTQCLTKAS